MAADILLLDPPHKIFGALRMWMPSPALMSLAACLEKNGIPVDLIDATVLNQPWTDLEGLLRQNSYKVVGVTCSAATFHFDAFHAIRLIRRVLPEAVIVAGGGHMTLNSGQILEEVPELDYIIMGEGERTLLEMINWFQENSPGTPCPVPGVTFRKKGEILNSGNRNMIPDLDTLPMPAYDKIDMENPVYYLHGMGRRTVGISTSRGCGDRCSYCSESSLWQATWRGRSGPLVVEEMEMLNRNYGKSLFVFNENSFNQNRQRNEAFLESLGRSNLKCDYWFQSRVKDILRDRDLLKEYKRLGCYEVMLGVESIQPDTLKNYTKSQTHEQIKEAAELLNSHGIMVMTNVMFGDVNDTEETLKKIYDFVIGIGDFLVLTITTPLPGTRYYQTALEDGRIEEHDFSCYDFMHPIMPNNTYSRDQVRMLQEKYLKKYYTRPAIFFKMFFSPNPFIRMAYRLIMRFAWYEARNKEWIQENYEEVPAYLLDK
jgi:anaerobic magnesium-protoporphyrin IX monomethyl ester cyclase